METAGSSEIWYLPTKLYGILFLEAVILMDMVS
jgi:hypothetical protein